MVTVIELTFNKEIIMAVYSYLRVSTIKQDEENQKLGVIKKAEELNLTIDKFFIDKISGIQDPNKRKNFCNLLKILKKGDVIIVSEISRLGRKLLIIFKLLDNFVNKGIHVYSAKENFCLDDSIQSKIIAFAFGIAAEIERNLISSRTKEALALRKLQGKKLGRPFGSITKHHKLDRYRNLIIELRKEQISFTKIGKRCKCDPKTVKKYCLWL